MIKSDLKKKKKTRSSVLWQEGKVISFKLEATITVIPTNSPCMSGCYKEHPDQREVKRWPGVPQKSLPGLLLTDPAPHTRGGWGGHIQRPVFAPSGAGVGFKQEGVRQRMRGGKHMA